MSQSRASPAKPRHSRKIVDVADWGRSEVSGVAEGNSHKTKGRPITSMRSSLFKKTADSMGVSSSTAAGSSSGAPAPEAPAQSGELIFGSEEEAGELIKAFTHIENDSLTLCHYGKENRRVWVNDIFALAHNGIRCELKDLSTMLHALKYIHGNVTTAEFGDFRRWWAVFSGIVSDYVSLEMTILLPWVEEGMKRDGCDDPHAKEFLTTAPPRLKTLKGAAVAIGKLFCIICDELPPALRAKAPSKQKAASSILMHTDRFISLMADFLWEAEMQLSGVLSSGYDGKEDREKIFTDIVAHMTDGTKARTDEWLVLQTRWMTDQKIARNHMKQLNILHRFSPAKVLALFETQHRSIILDMQAKAEM